MQPASADPWIAFPDKETDLNVAVVISDGTRDLTTAKSFGKFILDPAPYGETFAKVVTDRFRRE